MSTHRRGQTRVLGHLGLLIGLGLSMMPFVQAPPVAAAAGPPQVTATEVFAPQTSPVTAVRGMSCPTETVCYLASSTLRRSADGGLSWQQLPNPAGWAVFNDVDCSSVTRCTAVSDGGDLLSTSDAGSSWTQVQTGGPALAFMRPTRVSCPSASTCFAIGTAAGVPPLNTVVVVTRDGGATWSRLAIPATTSKFTGLACPTELACRAVASGEVLRTDDGGTHWVLSVGAAGAAPDIACISSMTCLSSAGMASPMLMRTLDGGATWQDIWPPFVPIDMSGLAAIDCLSPTSCVVVGVKPRLAGGQGAAIRIDPTTAIIVESVVPEGVNGLNVVDCQGNRCVALGRDIVAFATGRFGTMTSADGGGDFTLAAYGVSASVADVVCWTAVRCLAVGQNGITAAGGTTHGLVAHTTDGGTTWTRATLPDSVGPITRVVCASTTMCVAAATVADATLARTLIRTVDGGATWSVGSLPTSPLSIADVVCPTEMTCLATASTGVAGDPKLTLRSIDRGLTWSTARSWSSFVSPTGMDCVNAGTCFTLVFDAAGASTLWRSVDSGVTWAQTATPVGRSLLAIRCTGTGCLLQTGGFAQSLELFSTSDLGNTWTPVSGPATVQRSCATNGWCVAVLNDAGAHIFSSSDSGGRWTEQTGRVEQTNLYSLTCPIDTRCFATARGGARNGVLYRLDLTAGPSIPDPPDPPAPPAPSLVPLPPTRILDTRPGGTTIDGQFAGGSSRRAVGTRLEVTLAGRAGVPMGATAVVLNVTATGTAGMGYATVWPCDTDSPPNASNLNYAAGQTVPNLVVAPLSPRGRFCVQTTESAADLLADVSGYFPASSAYRPLPPARLLDTRAGTSTIDGKFAGIGERQSGSRLEMQVTGRGGVALGAAAVVLNVTVTGSSAGGFVTVWPCDSPAPPNASNLNFVAGQTVPNLVIAPLSPSGSVCVQTAESAAHLLADVSGYFPTASTYTPLTPQRVLDTRDGGRTADGRFAAIGLRQPGVRLELTISGRADVPAGASAVVLNVTVTDTRGGGFLTVWPCDTPGPPNASNLNYVAGQTVPNLVIAPLSPAGTVCLQTVEAGAHVLADVSGFFRASA